MQALAERFNTVIEQLWRERVQARTELRDRLPSGASVGDLYVLDVILRDELITMGELAKEMGITPATATTAVNRLIRHGWALRVPDERDRRIIRIRATAHGRRVHENRDAFRREVAARSLSRLPATDAVNLVILLERLLAASGDDVPLPADRR